MYISTRKLKAQEQLDRGIEKAYFVPIKTGIIVLAVLFGLTFGLFGMTIHPVIVQQPYVR